MATVMVATIVTRTVYMATVMMATIVANAMAIRVAEVKSITVNAETEIVGVRGMGKSQYGRRTQYPRAIFEMPVHNSLRGVSEFLTVELKDTGVFLNRG